MIPDAEIISMLCSILTKLEVGPFTVKVHLCSLHIIPMRLDSNCLY